MKTHQKNCIKKNRVSAHNTTKTVQQVLTVLTLILCLVPAGLVLAADDDPLTSINKLTEFFFSLIRALGVILSLFGMVQIGLAVKSHDGAQRAQGFLVMAGGLIVFFAKEILGLIGVQL